MNALRFALFLSVVVNCLAATGCALDADDLDGDGVTVAKGDCDDLDPSVFPGATELCNGIDDDCNDLVDDETGDPYYPDEDADGYGDLHADTELACEPPQGTAPDNTDCNDDDATIHPDAPELCDPEDRNCDSDPIAGATDELTWWPDADGDGFGDGDHAQTACDAPPQHAADCCDCDDNNADIHPAATEACDGIDNNCDGAVDENC